MSRACFSFLERTEIMMFKVILSSAIIFLSGLFSSGPAYAVEFCAPSKGTACLSDYCKTLGESRMDGDYTNLITCLSTVANNKDCSTGNCKWIAMTTSPTLGKIFWLPLPTFVSTYAPSCLSQSHYMECTNGCSIFCKSGTFKGEKLDFASGFLSSYATFEGVVGCSCFYK